MGPKNCFGKPCIRGLRVLGGPILAYFTRGMRIDEMLKQWPELEREEAYQALGFAASVIGGERLA
jgi:uncharacterized protein (DUF433 family)